MKITHWVLVLFLTTFLTGTVFGQEEQAPISTDRPSFTTGPILVEPGVWQLELGYTYRDDISETDIDVGTFPEALVRYGLDGKWELRFGWDGYSFVDDMDDMAGDTSLGFKYRMFYQQDMMPTMALITTVSLPTGSGESELDPQFLLSWNYEWDNITTLAGNLGIGFPTDEITGDRFSQGVLSLMCSRELNDSASTFAEYYTNFPATDEQDAEHVLQAGVLYLLNLSTQIDIHAGVGLNDQADDWFVGIGLSCRF